MRRISGRIGTSVKCASMPLIVMASCAFMALAATPVLADSSETAEGFGQPFKFHLRPIKFRMPKFRLPKFHFPKFSFKPPKWVVPPQPPAAPGPNSNPFANWQNPANIFNTPVGAIGVPADPNSGTWNGTYGSASVKPFFGTTYAGAINGYYLNTVSPATPLVPVSFAYGDESDVGPPGGGTGYPLNNALIVEGAGVDPAGKPIPGLAPNTPKYADCHCFARIPGLNGRDCYCELYAVSGGPNVPIGNTWLGGSYWDLSLDNTRPDGWTSADAAGIAMNPVMCKWEEASTGTINHMLSITTNHTDDNPADGCPYFPATHVAGVNSKMVPAMGAIWVLNANFDVSGYSKTNQAILNALKRYGAIVSDNGASGGLLGNYSPYWNDSDLAAIRNVTLNNGYWVNATPIEVRPGSYLAYQSYPPNTGGSVQGTGGSSATTTAADLTEAHHSHSGPRAL